MTVMNATLALKTCEHCGRENDQGATICIGCGFTSLKPLITIVPAHQLFFPAVDEAEEQRSEADFDQCQNVVACVRGLVETHHGKEIRFIPRDAITNVSFYYGCTAHRPALETTTGCVLAIVGVIGFWNLITTGVWTYNLTLMGLGILGVSMLLDVFRNHYFLRVTTLSTEFKIKFDRAATAEEIETF